MDTLENYPCGITASEEVLRHFLSDVLCPKQQENTNEYNSVLWSMDVMPSL